VPLGARQPLVSSFPVELLAPAAATEGVRARVPRIVESAGGATQAQRRPGQLALARAGGHARGEEQPLLAEVLDGGVRRTGAGEGRKQQPHRLLHLRVGIEDHAPGGVVDEADGQTAAQLASARLVQ